MLGSSINDAFTGFSHGAAGEKELTEFSHKTSHESVSFCYVNFTLVVYIELCRGFWKELVPDEFYTGFIDLIDNKQGPSTSFLCSIHIKELLVRFLSSGVGHSNRAVTENLANYIIFISTKITWKGVTAVASWVIIREKCF